MDTRARSTSAPAGARGPAQLAEIQLTDVSRIDRPRTSSPLRVITLRAIPSNPARFDVEARFADRQPRLVAEAGDESEEGVDVGEVADEPERRADRPGALAA